MRLRVKIRPFGAVDNLLLWKPKQMSSSDGGEMKAKTFSDTEPSVFEFSRAKTFTDPLN